MSLKTCICCGSSLPLADFYKRKESKDGYRNDCKECVKRRATEYNEKNNESCKEKKRERYHAKINEDPEFKTKLYWKNVERERQNNLASYRRHRERRIADAVQWARENPGKARANRAAYRIAKINATPPWADRMAIQSVYERAAALGMEVDHIVPLRGRTVCGLHVPWNLQLLTREENAMKSNRLVGFS